MSINNNEYEPVSIPIAGLHELDIWEGWGEESGQYIHLRPALNYLPQKDAQNLICYRNISDLLNSVWQNDNWQEELVKHPIEKFVPKGRLLLEPRFMISKTAQLEGFCPPNFIQETFKNLGIVLNEEPLTLKLEKHPEKPFFNIGLQTQGLNIMFCFYPGARQQDLGLTITSPPDGKKLDEMTEAENQAYLNLFDKVSQAQSQYNALEIPQKIVNLYEFCYLVAQAFPNT